MRPPQRRAGTIRQLGTTPTLHTPPPREGEMTEGRLFFVLAGTGPALGECTRIVPLSGKSVSLAPLAIGLLRTKLLCKAIEFRGRPPFFACVKQPRLLFGK